MKRFPLLCGLSALFLLLQAQDTGLLTNKDVIELLEAGLSSDIVIAKIKNSPCKFDTSIEALKQLKEAQVPETVILAMVEASTAPPKPFDASRAPSDDVVTAPLGKFPRIYIQTEQGENTFSGIFGGIYTQKDLDPLPEITRKLIEKAQEESFPIEVVFEKDQAHFVWLLGRENKALSRLYAWVLLDRATSLPYAYGKERLFRNAVKDVVHFTRLGWNSKLVQTEAKQNENKNITVQVVLPPKLKKQSLEGKVVVDGTSERKMIKVVSLTPDIAKVGDGADFVIVQSSGGPSNVATFKVTGTGKKGTGYVNAFVLTDSNN